MDFFNKNLLLIKKTAPHSVKTVDSLLPPPPCELAANGEVTVKIGSVQIASSVDPVAEGRKFAAAQSGAGEGLLVYGLGLGYHLEAILKLYPTIKVTVMEANREILAAAMAYRDLAPLLSNDRFSLVTGSTDVELAGNLSAALPAVTDDWEIAVHTPSYRCFPHGFDKVRNSFERLLSERRYKERFGKQEKKNLRANIPAISRSAGVSSIYGKLKGRPAVLVGAGPSLDRNLAMLDWLQKNTFILAVDTLAAVLPDSGIACHALVSIDPQPASAAHFTDGPPKAPVIFFPTTHPWVVEHCKHGRLLAIKTAHSLFKKAETLFSAKEQTDAGGSVSCVALDLLVKAGADPIGIVGQDFGFPHRLPYNRRTFSALSNGAPVRADTVLARAILGEHENLTTSSVSGGGTVTHANLLSYLKTFEEIIEKTPGRRFYNLDPCGAAIKGARSLSGYGEVSKHFPPVENMDAQLVIAREKPRPEFAGRLAEQLFG